MAKRKNKRSASLASAQPAQDIEHSGTGNTRVLEEGAVSDSHYGPETTTTGFGEDPARVVSAVVRGDAGIENTPATTIAPASVKVQGPSTPAREHWTSSFGTGTPTSRKERTSAEIFSRPGTGSGPTTTARQSSFSRSRPTRPQSTHSRRLSQVTFDEVVNVIEGGEACNNASYDAADGAWENDRTRTLTMEEEQLSSEGLSAESVPSLSASASQHAYADPDSLLSPSSYTKSDAATYDSHYAANHASLNSIPPEIWKPGMFPFAASAAVAAERDHKPVKVFTGDEMRAEHAEMFRSLPVTCPRTAGGIYLDKVGQFHRNNGAEAAMKLGRYAPTKTERETAALVEAAERTAKEEIAQATYAKSLAGATSAHYAAMSGPTATDIGLPSSTFNMLSGARAATGGNGLLVTPVYYTGPSGRDLVSSKQLLAKARERVDDYMADLQKDMEYRGLVPAPESYQRAAMTYAQKNAQLRAGQGRFVPGPDDVYIGGSGRAGYIKRSQLEDIARSRVDSQFQEINTLAEQRRAAMNDGDLDAGFVLRTRQLQKQWRADIGSEKKGKTRRFAMFRQGSKASAPTSPINPTSPSDTMRLPGRNKASSTAGTVGTPAHSQAGTTGTAARNVTSIEQAQAEGHLPTDASVAGTPATRTTTNTTHATTGRALSHTEPPATVLSGTHNIPTTNYTAAPTSTSTSHTAVPTSTHPTDYAAGGTTAATSGTAAAAGIAAPTRPAPVLRPSQTPSAMKKRKTLADRFRRFFMYKHNDPNIKTPHLVTPGGTNYSGTDPLAAEGAKLPANNTGIDASETAPRTKTASTNGPANMHEHEAADVGTLHARDSGDFREIRQVSSRERIVCEGHVDREGNLEGVLTGERQVTDSEGNNGTETMEPVRVRTRETGGGRRDSKVSVEALDNGKEEVVKEKPLERVVTTASPPVETVDGPELVDEKVESPITPVVSRKKKGKKGKKGGPLLTTPAVGTVMD